VIRANRAWAAQPTDHVRSTTLPDMKRLLRSSTFQGLLCLIAANYIRLVYLSSRWRTEGHGPAEEMIRNGKPFIAAFWHGRLLMAPMGWRRTTPLAVMISQHRDGEMIARTVRYFGVRTVRGSSTRGGAKAFREMLDIVKSGTNVAITPDGPRGPRMRAQAGIVLLARLSGVPIVPATYSVSRRRLASSWDHFVIALPFTRGLYLWGDPIHVKPNADDKAIEVARLSVERSLNELSEAADRRMGVEPVIPAEAETT